MSPGRAPGQGEPTIRSVVSPGEVEPVVRSVLRLQRRAYAVEAALIGDDRIPALHESLADVLAADLHWLLASDGDRIVGALGYTLPGGVVAIDRLVVAPDHHRRGIGARLVRGVLDLRPEVQVSTGRDNHPARALYSSLGFEHRGDREVIDGLWVSDYRRDRGGSAAGGARTPSGADTA